MKTIESRLLLVETNEEGRNIVADVLGHITAHYGDMQLKELYAYAADVQQARKRAWHAMHAQLSARFGRSLKWEEFKGTDEYTQYSKAHPHHFDYMARAGAGEERLADWVERFDLAHKSHRKVMRALALKTGDPILVLFLE